MEKILLSVKQRIPNTEEFEEFNSSVMENNGQKTYSFDSNILSAYNGLKGGKGLKGMKTFKS